MKIAIYTAIFGGYDKLIPQPELENVDFICFSDRPLKSSSWEVRVVQPLYENDHTRNNRLYKILPHKYLPEYKVSIYIDGNFLVLEDVHNLSQFILQRASMGAFCHTPPIENSRNCVYEEYKHILSFLEKGLELDDPEILEEHIQFLHEEKYPRHNGLIAGGVLLRNHQDIEVQRAMELWWEIVRNKSKRDQLSFNYVAWKTGLDFCYIPGEICEGNPWFYKLGGHKQALWFRMLKYRIRRKLGIIRHLVEEGRSIERIQGGTTQNNYFRN